MDATDRIIYAQTDRGARIGTARDTIGALKSGMQLLRWFQGQARVIGFPFKASVNGSVDAEINHGRWIVRCPACAGAEEVDPDEPVFYCLSCGNADVGGHVMMAVFPDDRGEIEAALLKRLDIGTRNWNTNESLEDLEAENAGHGIGSRE